jgi:hypothetical protein
VLAEPLLLLLEQFCRLPLRLMIQWVVTRYCGNVPLAGEIVQVANIPLVCKSVSQEREQRTTITK